MEHDKVEALVSQFLSLLPEDMTREGLKDTPARVARMTDELFSGYGKDPKDVLSRTFPACPDAGIVVERDIAFASLCEHHLLPFYGTVSISYLPGRRVVGLSKLARLVEIYARRLQIQENMTEEIASALMENLDCQGVVVRVRARHMCLMMRGVERRESETVTMTAKGLFKTDEVARREALSLMDD